MLGSVSTYQRHHHTFVGGEFGAFVKRLAKRSGRDLDVVKYENVGTFCVVEFLSPNRDVFIDIMNLGRQSPNSNFPDGQELLRRIFKPVTADETSRFLSESDSDYHHQRQDWNEEEHECEARLAKGE